MIESYRLLPSEAELVDRSKFEVIPAGDYVRAQRIQEERDESGSLIPGLALRARNRDELRRALEIAGTYNHTAQVKSGKSTSGSFKGAGAEAWLAEQKKSGVTTIQMAPGGEFSEIKVDEANGTVSTGPAVTFKNLRDRVSEAWSLTTDGAFVTATLQATGGVADGGEGTHSDLRLATWMDGRGEVHTEEVEHAVPYHLHRLPGAIRPDHLIFDSVGRGGAFGVSLDTTIPLPRRAIRRSFVLTYHGKNSRGKRELAHRRMLEDALKMNRAAYDLGQDLQFRFGGLEGMDFRAMDAARHSGNVFVFPDDTYSAVVVHTLDFRPDGGRDELSDFLIRMDDHGLLPEGLLMEEAAGRNFMPIDNFRKLELFRLAGPDEARKLIGAEVAPGIRLNHSMSTDPGLNALDNEQVMDVGMGIFDAQEDLVEADPHARPVWYAHLTGEQDSPRVTIHGRVAAADAEAFAAYRDSYYGKVEWWQAERIENGRPFREFAEKPLDPFKWRDRILMARGLTLADANANKDLMDHRDPDGLFIARQVERWPGFIDLVRSHSVRMAQAAK